MSDQSVFSKSFTWIAISLSVMVVALMILPFAYENTGHAKIAVMKDPVATCDVTYPEPKGPVNDYTSLLNAAQIKQLDSILIHYQKETSNQLAVVIVDSALLQGCDLDHFTYGLARDWYIGKNDENGIVLSICTQLREMSIHKGPGMEKILSVEATNNILQEMMAPEFKAGNYFEGIRKGVVGIINDVTLPPPPALGHRKIPDA
jgi:uncharacterized protein